MLRADILALPRESLFELINVYPEVEPTLDEGWHGAEYARWYLGNKQPQVDRQAALLRWGVAGSD